MIDLPYKMVFAIGTIDSLYIYDTQSIVPKYAVTNIHFQALTDLAWNGSSLLAASSADGYISFFMFEKNELGIPEEPANLPEELKIVYENYLNIDSSKSIFQGQNGKNKFAKHIKLFLIISVFELKNKIFEIKIIQLLQ